MHRICRLDILVVELVGLQGGCRQHLVRPGRRDAAKARNSRHQRGDYAPPDPDARARHRLARLCSLTPVAPWPIDRGATNSSVLYSVRPTGPSTGRAITSPGQGYPDVPGQGYPSAPGPGYPDVPEPGYPDVPGPEYPDVPGPGYPDVPGPGCPDAPEPACRDVSGQTPERYSTPRASQARLSDQKSYA
ncbi:MAG: hypothetical protein EPO23_06380 [Xanthobacteraceae bacterium]|nr:MAG: hypothetical protein EPO23_06380 [Xanthobacteraceae bacterium]